MGESLVDDTNHINFNPARTAVSSTYEYLGSGPLPSYIHGVSTLSEANLISISQPTEYTGCSTAEELVAWVARVSNPSNQNNTATGPKLVKYLVGENHWSPLEMVSLSIEIKTTRDIARQMLRHRSFSFQEYCVAEGTLITTLTNSGNSKKVPIEDLYKRYTNPQYSNMSDWLVRVYDSSSKLLKAARVKEVFKTGKKDCYELTLENGKTIKSTKDHKFLTKDGFKRLESIDSNDFVAVNGIPVWQDKEWLQEAKTLAIETGAGVQGIADLAECSYHTIRKWLRVHSLQFTKDEVSSYTPVWNKGLPKELQPRYGVHTSKETRLKQSESARKGSESNLYVNGNKSFDTIDFRQRVAQVCKGAHLTLLIKQDYSCAICDDKIDRSSSEVDHILPVSMYPELAYDEDNNLQTLCKECHREKTELEANEGRLTVTYHKVKSIEYVGNLETYDMEIDHVDHNYVANGIVTHNSQRYADPTKDLGYTLREARLQDMKNRQNSVELSPDENRLADEWDVVQKSVINAADFAYKWAIDRGIAKEQARSVLPEGCTKSTIIMAGTLRSWIHYCQLRRANGTQKEHMIVADQCWDIIKQRFPGIEEALGA